MPRRNLHDCRCITMLIRYDDSHGRIAIATSYGGGELRHAIISAIADTALYLKLATPTYCRLAAPPDNADAHFRRGDQRAATMSAHAISRHQCATASHAQSRRYISSRGTAHDADIIIFQAIFIYYLMSTLRYDDAAHALGFVSFIIDAAGAPRRGFDIVSKMPLILNFSFLIHYFISRRATTTLSHDTSFPPSRHTLLAYFHC